MQNIDLERERQMTDLAILPMSELGFRLEDCLIVSARRAVAQVVRPQPSAAQQKGEPRRTLERIRDSSLYCSCCSSCDQRQGGGLLFETGRSELRFREEVSRGVVAQ